MWVWPFTYVGGVLFNCSSSSSHINSSGKVCSIGDAYNCQNNSSVCIHVKSDRQ